MVKTCESWIPPSPNLDKVRISFYKLKNTDVFPSIHGVYIVHTMNKGTQVKLKKQQMVAKLNGTFKINLVKKTLNKQKAPLNFFDISRPFKTFPSVNE